MTQYLNHVYLIDAFKWSHCIFTHLVSRAWVPICKTFVNINTCTGRTSLETCLALNGITPILEHCKYYMNLLPYLMSIWRLGFLDYLTSKKSYLPSSSFKSFPYPHRSFSHLKDPLVLRHLYMGPRVLQSWVPNLDKDRKSLWLRVKTRFNVFSSHLDQRRLEYFIYLHSSSSTHIPEFGFKVYPVPHVAILTQA